MGTRCLVAIGLVGVLVASPALARQASDAPVGWPEVVGKLILGEQEQIELLDGTRVSGTLVGVSGTTIEIGRRTRRPEPPIEVAFDKVRTIRQGRVDGVANGTLRGLGIGALLGGLATLQCSGDLGLVCLVFAGIGAGAGAGVGLAVDAVSTHGQELIYTRPAISTSGLRLSPILGGMRGGVMLSVGF